MQYKMESFNFQGRAGRLTDDAAEAHQVLDSLEQIGAINAERGACARSLYGRLHEVVQAAFKDEQTLHARAQQLACDAQAGEAAAAAAVRRAEAFSGVRIDVLREDAESAAAEAGLAQDRAALLQLEQQELARQRDRLSEHLESLSEQHAAALMPLIQGIQEELAALRVDADAQRLAAAEARAELEAARTAASESSDALAAVRQEARAEANRLTSLAGAPERARRQADMAVAELAGVRQLLEAADGRLGEADVALRGAQERAEQRQAEHSAALAALERARSVAEAKERHADGIAHDVELAALEREKVLADQVDLDMRLRGLEGDALAARSALSAAHSEKMAALRALRAAEEALKAAQEELPPQYIARDLAMKDKTATEADTADVALQIQKHKREVEERVSTLLKAETIGRDKAALFDAMREEVALLESEVAELKVESRQTSRLLADMTAQRDRAARHAALVRAKVGRAAAVARLRARQHGDVQRVLAEVGRRGRDCERLYDLVRNQRNKFVTLIASAGQAAAEMGDRLRLLGSESDVLAQDAADKTAALSRARAASAAVARERTALHGELHALGATVRARYLRLQEHQEEARALACMVQRVETGMTASRRGYAAAVAARNSTGVALIDASDELAMLHERAHVQEERVAAGAQELQMCDRELRSLRLQVAELERCLAATRSAMPDVPAIDAEVAQLKAELLLAQGAAESLGTKLEDPACAAAVARVRQLGGRIPPREELVAKLQSLGERLGGRTDALHERGLVLDEATRLTDSLREGAAAGRGTAAALSGAANTYQQRLHAATRALMATISELSLYQATALKLAAHKATLERQVADAHARVAAGEPPTQDADAEWATMARREEMMRELRHERDQFAAVLDAHGNDTPTTAVPRPNAYIPEDLGIPRPYGSFGPFKPRAAGACMRHIRAPVPRELVL